MKNKKLFAILTLVCFMFTLMPVAAFAAPADFAVVANADGSVSVKYVAGDGATGYGIAKGDAKLPEKTYTKETVTWDAKAVANLAAGSRVVLVNESEVVKSFEISAETLAAAKATAAIAGNNTAVADKSLFVPSTTKQQNAYQVPAKGTVDTGADVVEFEFLVKDNAGKDTVAALDNVYIWAVDVNGNRTSALNVESVVGVEAAGNGNAVSITRNAVDNTFGAWKVTKGDKVNLSFAVPGTYTVYAGTYNADTANQTIANAIKLGGAHTVTVYGQSVDPETTYKAGLNTTATGTSNALTPAYPVINGVTTTAIYTTQNDGVIGTLNATPNNVAEKVVVDFYNGAYTMQAGKTVAIDTDSANIKVSAETATTNTLGQITFNLSAAREGVYTIYLEIDGVDFAILVNCGNTHAAYIELEDAPEGPVALYESGVDVEFYITDINGNAVKNANSANNGANGIFDLGALAGNVKYLSYIEKPATSSRQSSELTLENEGDGIYSLDLNGNLDAEGKYTVRAILDNGAYADVTWEVKKFDKPVSLNIDAVDTIELGTDVTPDLYYLDKNGVQKDAKDAELAATGYAIYSFNGETVVAKTDEKYAGSVITLTAVSERYDLVAVKEIKVAAEAVAIEFVTDTLAVNVNNKVEWNVVDEAGNAVTLNDKYDVETIKYIVLDKPEGAKVSVYDLTPASFDGEGKMALTCDTVGKVAIQVVAQVKVESGAVATLGAEQTKYYTGTQIFAVGTEGVGDVVVMSIGSNEIVKNDKVATMIAAPIVQNERTFVPFRALAEAFGAEVAWDEATQAVTAELNGVTVVMTIGSAEYTINGEAATMDVAPFLGNDSTMVPVRFVAQAFGIKVIPTYDANGATADILFNL